VSCSEISHGTVPIVVNAVRGHPLVLVRWCGLVISGLGIVEIVAIIIINAITEVANAAPVMIVRDAL
jgi:hypothetical protein